MKKVQLIINGILVCLIVMSVQSVSAQNWPQWRGPLATGEALSGNPPIEWSEQENVRWKIRLSGTGHSTPAVWGNNIFITAAKPTESDAVSSGIVTATKPVKFLVIAVDRKTGKVKWERTAREEVPHQTRNNQGAWVTASPITDGKRVYAFFGSRGLYCYTFEGKLIWEKDFGDMDTQGDMGEGASPVLYKDKLIVQWDHLGEDFIAALEASTGQAHYSNTRLTGINHIFASPSGVGDKVYFLGRDGLTIVIRSGSEFHVLSKNTLDDKFDASPVIVGDEIYLRGHQYLYCISR